MTIDPDQQTVVGGANNQGIFIWKAGGNLKWLSGDTMPASHCIALSADGKTLAGGNGAVGIWDFAALKRQLDSEGWAGSVERVQLTADGKGVYIQPSSTDFSLYCWEIVTKKNKQFLLPEDATFWRLPRTARFLLSEIRMEFFFVTPVPAKCGVNWRQNLKKISSGPPLLRMGKHWGL